MHVLWFIYKHCKYYRHPDTARNDSRRQIHIFLVFPENRFWHNMKILNLFLGKIRKVFQNDVCWFFLLSMLSTRGLREGVTSYIWHSMDVRAEWPPFSALSSIWLAPFFSKKVYDWPHFSGLLYESPHFSDVSRYMHVFFVQKFFEATCSLGIQWIDCYIYLTTSNKWVQKTKGQMGRFFQRPGKWLG